MENSNDAAGRFRVIAAESTQQALNTPFVDVSDAYSLLASAWLSLAKETELQAMRTAGAVNNDILDEAA
jgi:hypothetical protein